MLIVLTFYMLLGKLSAQSDIIQLKDSLLSPVVERVDKSFLFLCVFPLLVHLCHYYSVEYRGRTALGHRVKRLSVRQPPK